MSKPRAGDTTSKYKFGNWTSRGVYDETLFDLRGRALYLRKLTQMPKTVKNQTTPPGLEPGTFVLHGRCSNH